MATGQLHQVQEDFGAGMVLGVGLTAMDPRGVLDHENGFYEDDGGAYMRGGSRVHSNQLPSPSTNPMTWVWDGYFDAGRRTVCASPSGFYVLDADDKTPISLGGGGAAVPPGSA